MNSFVFPFNQVTFENYAQRIQGGEKISISYVAAKRKRPFETFNTGDEIFIVGVDGGRVRLAGRMIVRERPISYNEAVVQSGRKDLLQKDLVCFGDENYLDHIRMDLFIPREILDELDLRKIDGTRVNTETLKTDKPAPQVFASIPQVGPNSAEQLRKLLNLTSAAAGPHTTGRQEADEGEGDDQIDDDEYRMQAIKTRRGQPRFRENLMQAYRGRCVVTGCAIKELLEAAHITPHAKRSDYRVSNGLLLRADIHTLFDEGLLTVDERCRVVVSPLVKDLAYRHYDGKIIQTPDKSTDQPNADSLKARFQRLRRTD